MLARRFTIVCLLSMLFGIFFAVLVENNNRPERTWQIGQVILCDADNGRCTPSQNQ